MAVEKCTCPHCGGEVELPKKGKAQRVSGDFGIPLLLDTPDFRAAWSRWIAHRAEMGHHLTPLAASTALRRMEAMGPSVAVEAIDNSIEHGWRKVFQSNGRAVTESDPNEVEYKRYLNGAAR